MRYRPPKTPTWTRLSEAAINGGNALCYRRLRLSVCLGPAAALDVVAEWAQAGAARNHPFRVPQSSSPPRALRPNNLPSPVREIPPKVELPLDYHSQVD